MIQMWIFRFGVRLLLVDLETAPLKSFEYGKDDDAFNITN